MNAFTVRMVKLARSAEMREMVEEIASRDRLILITLEEVHERFLKKRIGEATYER